MTKKYVLLALFVGLVGAVGCGDSANGAKPTAEEMSDFKGKPMPDNYKAQFAAAQQKAAEAAAKARASHGGGQ